MPQADVPPFRMTHQMQKLKHIVKIIHRLSDAHQDNVGDPVSRFLFRKQNFIKHFARR